MDGRIRGKVVADEGSDAVLRISEVGEVTGDINAPHVIINGTVNGDVYAPAHLELAEKASINGSVYYCLIEMAMGASVNGNLVHQREPVGLLSQDSKAAGSGMERIYVTGDYAENVMTGALEEHMDSSAIFKGTREEILEDIIGRLDAGDWILVKGSRGMAMEKVVEGLLRWAGNEN